MGIGKWFGMGGEAKKEEVPQLSPEEQAAKDLELKASAAFQRMPGVHWAFGGFINRSRYNDDPAVKKVAWETLIAVDEGSDPKDGETFAYQLAVRLAPLVKEGNSAARIAVQDVVERAGSHYALVEKVKALGLEYDDDGHLV